MKQERLITPDVIKTHGLSEEEYRRILELLGREPNITELGIFSVMWSEHCSYKSSRIHLKRFPTKGDCVIQGPGENAGIIDIGDGLAIAFKMESHNHPSFMEPFQGAATGVGGILRDVFTMGARPIANLNSLRFGQANHPKTAHLLQGVLAGIAFYGNCMGIPTVGGEIYFDASYNGNILVNAFTAGVVEKDNIYYGTAGGIGNPVIYVGSKTGRDGIHGATMASDVFGEGNEQRRPTVQVGDPFTEKLLLEACLEAMKTGAIVGIQDMGAAGLTSSSFEMASRAGSGIEMNLDHVPRREEGMTPYEILLSESQERMLMVVEKGREEEIYRIFQKWDLDVARVGKVTDDGFMRILSEGQVVVNLPIAPLADAAPLYERPMQEPTNWKELKQLDLAKISLPADYNDVLKKLLSSPNIASKHFAYRQFDHQVGTDTVVLPGSDAAVLRIKGTTKGIGLAVDCNSRYCYLDPYWGSALAIAECARNLAVSGAKAMAVTDCLNFGNPEKPEIMWQFSQSVDGLARACKEFQTPVVSGNVSLYNETGDQAIYPTPMIAMVGLMTDISRHTTQWFKNEGDSIILLGNNREEIGGSDYLALIHEKVCGSVPQLDFKLESLIQKSCLELIERGLVQSAHDVSNGGLAVALAECCISGDHNMTKDMMKGATIELNDDIRPDALLFGESVSRIILSVSESDEARVMEYARSHGCPAVKIGRVAGSRFVINQWINAPLDQLQDLWWNGLERSVFKC